jgi:hypothetical protein
MKPVKRIDQLDEESEKIRDILRRSPSWLVSWGSSVILIFVGVIILLSFIIKYPTIVKGQIVITTVRPPAKIVSHSDGYIEKIMFPDNSQVSQGEPLIIFRNSANSDDVLALYNQVKGTTDDQLLNNTLNFVYSYQLGEIQSYYDSFLEDYEEYVDFEHRKILKTKLEYLRSQIEDRSAILKKKKSLRDLNLDQFEYNRKIFDREKRLYDSSVISLKDFDQKSVEFIDNRIKLEQISLDIAFEEMSINTLRFDAVNIEKEIEKSSVQLRFRLMNSFNQLKRGFNDWLIKYVLVAPSAGRITYLTILDNNRFIPAHRELVSVVTSTDSLIGRMHIPLENSGRVKPNQKVNILLHDYPYYEYGLLVGKVESISAVSADNQYFVKIAIPNGLLSSYNKEIPFKNELLGNSEIITEDLRVIERIIFNLRELTRRQG